MLNPAAPTSFNNRKSLVSDRSDTGLVHHNEMSYLNDDVPEDEQQPEPVTAAEPKMTSPQNQVLSDDPEVASFNILSAEESRTNNNN